MICRVAESCFWMMRYIERAESVARLLEANRAFVLDAQMPHAEHWMPVVVVAGEEATFEARFGREAADDGELVQRYLCWDAQCPVSIFVSVRWARENARTIRETISLEMWQALNAFWIWLNEDATGALYVRDRRAFYAQVLAYAQQLRGLMEDSLSHDEPYDFMRLGLMLERANQIARQLDVKHHKLDTDEAPTGPEDIEAFSLWSATLRSCSATEAFLRQGKPPLSQHVLRFLVLDVNFPRSVLYALLRAQRVMIRIMSRGTKEAMPLPKSALALDTLVASLLTPEATTLVHRAMHQEMTRVVDTTAQICQQLHEDFFSLSASP